MFHEKESNILINVHWLSDTRNISCIWKSVWIILYIINIWAPSSEFVSSSIPSWQILTVHAQPFRGARDLAFCLKVPLDSLLVWASSEGSGETVPNSLVAVHIIMVVTGSGLLYHVSWMRSYHRITLSASHRLWYELIHSPWYRPPDQVTTVMYIPSIFRYQLLPWLVMMQAGPRFLGNKCLCLVAMLPVS